MTHDFVGWTPPPGAVVDPPVHPQTLVNVFYSDEVFLERAAGDINWSSVGDGPRVVAYAVVSEYKPKPKDYWIKPGFDHPRITETEPDRPHAYIHVREVPDPSREVVAWAVVRKQGGIDGAWNVEDHAHGYVESYGGTVVRLSGVMP